jgi:glycosyltransferase involved in cell wall biosynthesis
MNDEPLVSIIVNNYNYGRFLADAIDSALQQTYRNIEVIAVDDGSTDTSCAVIEGYADRIIPVLKPNGGQASAFNAGFERSRGEIVIFLDADDRLAPQIAERVVAAFGAEPQLAKVQYRLAVIDADSTPTGAIKPPMQQPLPNGNLRQDVLRFADDIPWLPTSGNAFAAAVLRRIFPVPEPIYRICADYYLSNLPPLFGTVRSLEEVGGFYRVHAANNHHTSQVNLDQTRQTITLTCHTHQYIKQFADELGLRDYPGDTPSALALSFLANRITSLKLEPQRHPITSDRLLAVWWQGMKAVFRRVDLSASMRLLYFVWFVLMVPAPKPWARWLAEKFFFPETRGQFNTLLRVARRRLVVGS